MIGIWRGCIVAIVMWIVIFVCNTISDHDEEVDTIIMRSR